MVHSGRPLAQGAMVELRRGDHVILARVMWRDGARAGLKSEARVPVEAIVLLGQTPAYQLTAPNGERRSKNRAGGATRLRGRAFEYASIVVVGVSLAGAGLAMIEQAFARPLAMVATALAP